MTRWYLVFWQDMAAGFVRYMQTVPLEVPPHDKLVGADLDDLIRRALGCSLLDPITGIVELANPVWSPGVVRDVSLGDGRVATLECQSGKGWTVHL